LQIHPFFLIYDSEEYIATNLKVCLLISIISINILDLMCHFASELEAFVSIEAYMRLYPTLTPMRLLEKIIRLNYVVNCCLDSIPKINSEADATRHMEANIPILISRVKDLIKVRALVYQLLLT